MLEKQPSATKLALVAVLASVITGSTILKYQSLRRRQRQHELELEKAAIADKKGETVSSRQAMTFAQDVSSSSMASLGSQGFSHLQKANVIIVGAGGVGSWAALMLLRAGVQRIRIIDFDQVSLSSLNRHAVATHEDVGTAKVFAIKKHFKEINPQAIIDSRKELLNASNVAELLGGNPDFVVDAIDNINTKVDLIKYCVDHNLPFISSMGAGAKADPSRIQIASIAETSEDPLTRAVRQRLKRLGIHDGVTVVYSTEKPGQVNLLPLEEERVSHAKDFAPLPDFRSRILPVLGTLPSMFGMAIAAHIALKIAQYPGYAPLPIKRRQGLYARMLKDLTGKESKQDPTSYRLDVDDVGYIVDELWSGKSTFACATKSTNVNDTRFVLSRWDAQKPLGRWNTAVLTVSEAKAHDAIPPGTSLVTVYGKETCEVISKRIADEQERDRMWRGRV